MNVKEMVYYVTQQRYNINKNKNISKKYPSIVVRLLGFNETAFPHDLPSVNRDAPGLSEPVVVPTISAECCTQKALQ
jgi:hypothetical protein